MDDYIRWYDSDRNLNVFLPFLESLSQEAQAEIASEILINIPNIMGQEDYDKFVNAISNNKPPGYKRWYDATLNLHTAVEALKEINEHQVEMLIRSISDVILKNSQPNGTS